MRYKLAQYPQDWICDGCGVNGTEHCVYCGHSSKKRMYVDDKSDRAYCSTCVKKRKLKCVSK